MLPAQEYRQQDNDCFLHIFQVCYPIIDYILSLAQPLLIRSSAQATGFRFATALSAHSAPALRFTLAVCRDSKAAAKVQQKAKTAKTPYIK